MTDDNSIDTEAPVMTAFRAAGYHPTDLVDPAMFHPGDVDVSEWRVVRLNRHGIEAFDLDGTSVGPTGRAPPYDVGVEHIKDAVQPVGFADESGLLNDDLDDVDFGRAGGGHEVTFFWGGEDVSRDVPVFSPEEAIEALGWWGHRGYVPRDTAEAMVAAFGGSIDRSVGRDDPDVEGEQIVRAPFVASAMTANADDVAQQSPDGDISGNDKRARQRFYRNLDALEAAYLDGDE